jgi:hypothetical protein
VRLEGSTLVTYPDRAVGQEQERLDLSSATNVEQVDARTIEVKSGRGKGKEEKEKGSKKGKEKKEAEKKTRLRMEEEGEATAWLREIRRAVDLCGRDGDALLLHAIADTQVKASVDCLAVVDGFVWSASSDFVLRQWDVHRTAVVVGLRADLVEIHQLRAVRLPCDQVDARHRGIARMASPLGSAQQVWVGAGNRVAVVDLSESKESKEGEAKVRYLEPAHEGTVTTMARTHAGGEAAVVTAGVGSREVWVWDARTGERRGVEAAAEGAGREVRCAVDAGGARWVATDSHVCRWRAEEGPENATTHALAGATAMEAGADGECVWVGGIAEDAMFSCWQ